MTRVIVILTIGRSGSSALAGALHQAGIPFEAHGDNMGNSRDFNPKGHFEWSSWWRAGKWLKERLTTDGNGVEVLIDGHRDLVKSCSAANPQIWGVKSPWFPWTLPHVIGLLPADHRVIVIRRGREATIQSFMRHGNLGQGMTYDEAAVTVDEQMAVLEATAAGLTCPVRNVTFEQIMAHTWRSMAGTLEFCYQDIAEVSVEQIEIATTWIDPELCHHA
jgi:hypothetical protein